MAKHKVRTSTWENGILKSFEHEFRSWEDALFFSQRSNAQTVKIYHENGELLHTVSNDPTTDSYA